MTNIETAAERPTDVEIATVAMEALRRDADVRGDGIALTVENRWVTLRGRADHVVQRSMAEVTVCYVPGVRGVTNLLDTGTRSPRRNGYRRRLAGR